MRAFTRMEKNMIVYVYSKCSTCKNALTYLEKRKIHFIRKEITETPPTIAELKKMLKFMNGNIKRLFNTSGQLYRELKLNEKLENMSEQEAFDLLSKNGMLVKRPFLLSDKFGLVGFKEKEWENIK